MRFRLKPHKHEFFTLFELSSANTVDTARLLVELLSSYPGNGEELIGRIKEREHEGDRLTYEIIQLINRTFVTPFDRDDIHRLATRLDDICDHIDEAAADVRLFDIKEVPEAAKEQATTILKAVSKLDEAVHLLDGRERADGAIAAVNQLEDEGDRLNRQAIADLFRSGGDPIRVMAWKEIHQQLEEALDACENAADTLEAIFVKNR